jgi:DNA-binding response OmpR family regulator
LKILLAEDEKDLSRALVAVLSHSGYETDAVYDGEAAVKSASEHAYDCMVFDIMMPKKDGIEALREIRSSGDHTPVIMLTAKAEVDDRVEGLDAGADDYLTKPFAMKELLARIRSQTRRADDFTRTHYQLGNVTLDTSEQELVKENSIRLAGKETKLMEFLMINAGKAVSTDEIFNRVWGDEPETDRSIVWIYISYLRQKLKAITADIEIDGEEGKSFTLRECQ